MNYDALRTAIEQVGLDAMDEPDAGNRKIQFKNAVRELRKLRTQAMASGIYSKANRCKADEMRRRAERRIAQLIIEGKAVDLLTTGRPTRGEKIGAQTDKLTLKDIGVSRKESQDWQKLARMSDAKFEAWLAAAKPITARLGRRGTRRHAHVNEAGQLSSTATMSIANIKIGTRHRKDKGDIAGLAASIADVGLLHPIVVRADGLLIAGERRLEACKQLGWTDVPVTVVDLDDIVRGELAENAERKDFLPSEIDAIRRALEPIEKLAAKERMSEGGKGGKVSQPSDGPVRARDKIGALAGVSGRTVEKIAAVVAAAEAEPERFGHLVDQMDKTGKVDRAHKQLKIERQRSKPAGRNDKPLSPEQAQAPSSEPTLFDQAPPLKPQPPPEQKPDAAPTPAGEPAPPPDPWAGQYGAFWTSFHGLANIQDVDFGSVAAAMSIDQLLEARDQCEKAALTIEKWSGALNKAIESAAGARDK